MLDFLKKLAFWKQNSADLLASVPDFEARSIEGPLNAEAALAFEDNQLVLSVDYQFDDIPAYVEFDVARHHINIVQQGGMVATLSQLPLPAQENFSDLPFTRITLLSRLGNDQFFQILSLIIKQPDKTADTLDF